MESNEKSVTIKEVIEMTINELRSLSIPADLLDQFGPPISRSLNNLRVIVQTLDQKEQEKPSTEPEQEWNPEAVLDESFNDDSFEEIK